MLWDVKLKVHTKLFTIQMNTTMSENHNPPEKTNRQRVLKIITKSYQHKTYL